MRCILISVLMLAGTSLANKMSLYSVTRNIMTSSLQSIASGNMEASPLEAYCTTRCTLDDECKSAIFDGDGELCYLLTDSQQLNKSEEYTSVIYFEKADCENTNNSSEGCCYVESMACVNSANVKIYQGKTKNTTNNKNQNADCQDAFDEGERESGSFFYLKPFPSWRVIRAVCQFDSTSGWTVIQRRLDGSVDFERDWVDYVNGFGYLTGEYWIGLESIYYLTQTNQKLSIFMEDFDGETRTANYSTFYIDSEDQKYINHISGYFGDAGDSWITSTAQNHAGQPFSTRDNDNDGSNRNCAEQFKGGGWWFQDCHEVNLNGRWFAGGHYTEYATGASWYGWRGHNYSYKTIYIRLSR